VKLDGAGVMESSYGSYGHSKEQTHKASKRRLEESGSDSDEVATKRARVDGEAASKVLHMRALPVETSEQELIGLVSGFGHVVNVLVLRSKNQAFVQMESEAAALAAVQYYQSVKATIR